MMMVGTVVQDVVADAMSTEVVARIRQEGNERPDNAKCAASSGMVQVLGRLSLSGWRAGGGGIVRMGSPRCGRAARRCFLIGLDDPG